MTTATITTAAGHVWRITAEVAAVTDADRHLIDRAIRTLAATLMEGARHEVEVDVPDHDWAIVELDA
jgi:hypothetical protein